MNEKGIDSAPTNFNKRDINSAYEQRAAYSRGQSGDTDRHAITAKISKRGWMGRGGNGDPKKFLSFYDEPHEQAYY